MSQRPLSIQRAAVIIEMAPVAHAAETLMTGPPSLRILATCLPTVDWRNRSEKPIFPLEFNILGLLADTVHPKREKSVKRPSRPLSDTASAAARNARDSVLASGGTSMPCTRALSISLNCSSLLTALCPRSSRFQLLSLPSPRGVTRPIPVITVIAMA